MSTMNLFQVLTSLHGLFAYLVGWAFFIPGKRKPLWQRYTYLTKSAPGAPVRERIGFLAKGISSSAPNTFTFVMSSEVADADGDIIRSDGWNLKRFRQNPIALWQHSSYEPIGRWSNIRVDNKRLIGDLTLASTPMAQMARTLIDEGVLRAVSVGFRVQEYEPIDPKKPYGAWDISKAELYETSLVSVPSNPEALLVAKQLGLTVEQKKLIFADLRQSSDRQPPAATSGIHPTVQRALDIREEIRASLRNRL